MPVAIVHEPSNPRDSKALAFVCTLEDKKHTIGYIIREVLDEVHLAISNGSVGLPSRIKCLIDIPHCCPLKICLLRLSQYNAIRQSQIPRLPVLKISSYSTPVFIIIILLKH